MGRVVEEEENGKGFLYMEVREDMVGPENVVSSSIIYISIYSRVINMHVCIIITHTHTTIYIFIYVLKFECR